MKRPVDTLIFACQMADTCRETLFLVVEETIKNLTVFFGKLITLIENQMPILLIIIIITTHVPYFTAV